MAREAMGATQKELADRLGVSDRTYSAWENGRNEPGYKYLLALADLFGTTPNEILLGETVFEHSATPANVEYIPQQESMARFLVSVVDRQLALMEQDRANTRKRIEEVEGPEAQARKIIAEKDKIAQEKERQIQTTADLMIRRLANIDASPHETADQDAEVGAVAK